MPPFYLDRPLVLAHRGASHDAPANTLAAFLLAVELGADGAELDVQLSSDGEVVVIHDWTLEGTTDGQGRVADHTLAQLQSLDAGSWFDPVYAGQRIPTLQEVIDAVGASLLLNIELKTESRQDDGLAAAVVRLVEENRLQDRVVISSFNPLAVWRVGRLNSSLPVGLLYSHDMPFYLRRPWLRHLVQPDALHPEYAQVDGAYMSWARERGYRVNTWTVDDPGDMWRLMRLGVDAIITNRPELLCRVLDAGRGRRKVGSRPLLAEPRKGR